MIRSLEADAAPKADVVVRAYGNHHQQGHQQASLRMEINQGQVGSGAYILPYSYPHDVSQCSREAGNPGFQLLAAVDDSHSVSHSTNNIRAANRPTLSLVLEER